MDIIVPVYNVENFLDRCIESLLNQKYTNYGVILVDDGSTDNSGKMCDSYARNHSIVKVVHRKNGGLSYARNTGVNHSKAEYITFVDSDDYVSTTYLDDLICGLSDAEIEMSAIGIVSISNSSNSFKKNELKKTIKLNTQDALMHMCYRKYIGFSACGKLFKREIVLKYPFPEGRLHEDMYTTFKLIGECKYIGYYDSTDYYYVQNEGEGITSSSYSEQHMDAVYAAKDICSYIDRNYPGISSAGMAALAFAYFLVTKSLVRCLKTDKCHYKEISKELRVLLFDKHVFFDRNIALRHRIQFAMASLGYTSMRLSWKLYYWIIKRRG